MTDLKIIMRIARTDLAILFYSPIAWFILIVFSFLTTASFTSLMENIVTDYDLSGGKEVSLSGICFLEAQDLSTHNEVTSRHKILPTPNGWS